MRMVKSMMKSSDGEKKNSSVSVIDSEGEWHVARKIVLPTMDCEFSESRLGKIFESTDGIDMIESSCRKSIIVVRYDIRHTFYSDVLTLLQDAGFPPKRSGWHQLRASWYRFSEGNMRDYSKTKVTSCCNKPPIGTKH